MKAQETIYKNLAYTHTFCNQNIFLNLKYKIISNTQQIANIHVPTTWIFNKCLHSATFASERFF